MLLQICNHTHLSRQRQRSQSRTRARDQHSHCLSAPDTRSAPSMQSLPHQMVASGLWTCMCSGSEVMNPPAGWQNQRPCCVVHGCLCPHIHGQILWAWADCRTYASTCQDPCRHTQRHHSNGPHPSEYTICDQNFDTACSTLGDNQAHHLSAHLSCKVTQLGQLPIAVTCTVTTQTLSGWSPNQ